MKWKLLLLKKSIIGRIPFADNVRKVKRKLLGYPPNYQYIKHTIDNYEKIKAAVIKSIGTGWFPTIPILFARDGAKKVLLTDLNIHMDEITFGETLSLLKRYYPDDAYLECIKSISDLPFEYLAPFHATEVEDKSIDLITSHLVLEHIPRSDIYSTFLSLRSKISDHGLSINLVDHSDHFEHFDKSISKVEFLTWSEELHGVINYLIKDGENRLRHHEYHQIFIDAGFDIVEDIIEIDEKTISDLNHMDIKYPFSIMTPEQLATLTSIYTLKPSLGH